ncbi:DUF2484 family protein [Paracoccus pacificus]|uniref:DUF2484 family protein n=1 Tax=Paracoccus pacificus TaxID=1463598 RepID=A0ABW4RAA2_9RHOB
MNAAPMVAMHGVGWLSLALVLLWVLAALLIGRLQTDSRRRGCLALIVMGIPVLGLVTWIGGPLAGLLAMGLGAAMLNLMPLRRSHRRDTPLSATE